MNTVGPERARELHEMDLCVPCPDSACGAPSGEECRGTGADPLTDKRLVHFGRRLWWILSRQGGVSS